MSALHFPTARISVELDPTERAVYTVIDCVADFERAVAEAHSVSRLLQLSDRMEACIKLLLEAKGSALDKANQV